jgi:hypothetical protein
MQVCKKHLNSRRDGYSRHELCSLLRSSLNIQLIFSLFRAKHIENTKQHEQHLHHPLLTQTFKLIHHLPVNDEGMCSNAMVFDEPVEFVLL